MKKTLLRYAVGSTAAAGLIVPLGIAPVMAEAPEGTQIQLLGITDFHGRLSDTGTGMASVIERERAENDMPTALMSTGDSIGASTYVSSSQEDNPTIDYLNAIGLDVSGTGNHEYDRGFDDLTGRVTERSDFPYVAANVYSEGTTDVAPGLEPYVIQDIDGIRVATIGAVTADTASLVSPDGISEIEFGDPTEAVNRVAQELEELPEDERPDITVVQAHTGPTPGSTDSIDSAVGSNAEFGNLAESADASIDALFFGHSHTGMNLAGPVADGEGTRPIMQAGNYGDRVAQVVMTSDGEGNWTVDSQELLSTSDDAGDPIEFDSPVVTEAAEIIAAAEAESIEIGSEVAGEVTEDITRAFTEAGDENRGGESTLGNLVADALKTGTEYTQLGEADFGITNPGGLRTDIRVDDIFNDEQPGEVTVAELNQVLPFANDHGVVTMTGEDVIGLFEEQWQPEGASRSFLHLGISEELEVVYDSEAERGDRVVSVEVDGEPIDPAAEYRVATLSFLAGGGDNFSSFANGQFEQSGMTDFEIWERYFNENTPVSPDKDERQADAALDIVHNGTAEIGISSEDDTSGEFVFNTTNVDEVAGPFVLSLDLPEGMRVDFGEYAAEAAAATEYAEQFATGAENTAVIDSLPAGGASIPFTVTGGETGEHTFTAAFSADPAAQWWDDNPKPLVHTTEVTFEVVEGSDDDASGDDQGSDDAAGDDQGSDDASGDDQASGGEDASGDDQGASGDDQGAGDDDRDDNNAGGGDLPRTGSELTAMALVALLLLAAGGITVFAVRRKKVAGL